MPDLGYRILLKTHKRKRCMHNLSTRALITCLYTLNMNPCYTLDTRRVHIPSYFTPGLKMPTYESFGVPSNYHVGTWTLRDSSQAKRNSPTYGATPCTPALINEAWCMIRGQSGGIILPWMEETLHQLHPVRGNRGSRWCNIASIQGINPKPL